MSASRSLSTVSRARWSPIEPGPTLSRWVPGPDLLLCALVVLVALLLRAAFLLRAPVFIIADSENYFLPGFQLANGLGFDLEARRAPLYPLFIAAVVRWIGQDLAALALAQHALGLLTVALTYWLGRLTFGRTAGLVAGLLVALNGSLLLSEHTVTTEMLFITLLTLAALLGVLALRPASTAAGWPSSLPGSPSPTLDQPSALRTRRAVLVVLAGFLLGLAALTRPVALGLLPGLPLLLALERPGWRRWLQQCLLYGLGLLLVLLPWMVRNYLTIQVFSTEGAFGQSLVGRTVRHDGFVFVDPTAAPDPDPRRQRARELMHESASRGSFITPLRRRLMRELGLDELQANQLMRDLAVEAVIRQPGYYLAGTGAFFVQLALGWPEDFREHWQSRRDGESREEWESRAEIAALLGPPSPLQEAQRAEAQALALLYQPGRYGPILLGLFAVGLLAAAIGPPAWRPALLPGLWAIALILVGVAFVGPVLRYRYPAEPFLAVLVGGGLSAIGTLACRPLARRRLAAA